MRGPLGYYENMVRALSNPNSGQHLVLIVYIPACFTVCADGGANWFYDLMQKQGRESTTVRVALLKFPGSKENLTGER